MSADNISPKNRGSKAKIYSALVSKVILIGIKNSAQNQTEANLSNHFTSKKTPKISVEDYIIRLEKYLKFDKSSLILSMIYLDRFCELNNFAIKQNNFHRLFLTCLIIAIKYNEDIHYDNTFNAKIGGVSLQQLNCQERTFLMCINFSLYVDESLFNIYVKKFNDL